MSSDLRTSGVHPRAIGLALALALAIAGCPPAEAPTAPLVLDASVPVAPSAPVDASTGAKESANEDAAVAAFAEEYLTLLEEISPEAATPLGLHGHDTELDARDKAAVARETVKEGAFLAKLEQRFPEGTRLSAGARTDLALLRGVLRTDLLRASRAPLETSPQMYTTAMGAIFSMTAREYAPGPDRAKAVVARLEKIPAQVGSASVNLVPAKVPRVWAEVAIERAKSAKAFFEGQRPFLEKNLPGELPRVKTALAAAIATYGKYADYLAKGVLPNAKGNYAAGEPYFTGLLRDGYFVTQSPADLEAMGRKVFAETEARMTETAKRIDPKATAWPAVVANVKRNHPKKDDLLTAYRFEVKRARDFLEKKDIVPFPAGDDLAVVDTPEFMRSTVTAAYDQPPPFDPVTRGFFFVTPVDPKLSAKKQEEMLRENDHGDIVDTAVHEAYPGHHLQLSFSAKNPSKIRKAYDAAIFSEGWALYSEELMSELGYYTDEERIMQLEWTLVRAARIVIDVGLHTKGMTFDEGVRFLTDKVHLEHELAVSEVKRYSMTPTQPLAYLTGREAIFAIRAKYKEREKEKFTLKRFHTELLTRGTIPPGLLEKELFAE